MYELYHSGSGEWVQTYEGLKKIKTLTSYTKHAQFLAQCEEDLAGIIESPKHIPSPYAYSADTCVYRTFEGKHVIIKETKHKHYEVFEVLGLEPKQVIS